MKNLRNALLLGLLLILTVVAPVLAVLADYTHYIDVQLINTSSATYPWVRAPLFLNATGMIAQGYMQADADDTTAAVGTTETPETTGYLTTVTPFLAGTSLAAYGSSTLTYEFSYPGAGAKDQGFVGYFRDLNFAADAATLDKTADIGLTVDYKGPFGTTDHEWLVQKGHNYGISILGSKAYGFVMQSDAGGINVTPGTGAWTDVDITAYILPGHVAKAAIVELHSGAAGGLPQVRPDGSAQDLNSGCTSFEHYQTIVGLGAGDIFEAKTTHAGDRIYLIGYTTVGTYYTTALDVSLAALAAWTDINLSAVGVPSTATAVIVQVVAPTFSADIWGLRPNGSTDARTKTQSGAGNTSMIIPCDASQVIEGYINAVTTDFFITGYFTSTDPLSWNVNATNISTASLAAYVDIAPDFSTTIVKPTWMITEMTGSLADNWALHYNGAASDVYIRSQSGGASGVVRLDEYGIAEQKISNAAVDMFVWGMAYGGFYPPTPRLYVESAALTANTAYTFSLTYTTPNLEFFVNGVSQGTSASAAFPTASIEPLYVGNCSGVVDDVRMGDAALGTPVVNLQFSNSHFSRTTRESYIINDDAWQDIYGANWVAQTFLAGSTARVNEVRFKAYRVSATAGLPGIMRVSLYATAAGLPVSLATSVPLSTVNIDTSQITTNTVGAWYSYYFPAVSLTTATTYAVVFRAVNGNATNGIKLRIDGSAPTYASGSICTAPDSGVTWSAVAGSDAMFAFYDNQIADQSVTATNDMYFNPDIQFPAGVTMTVGNFTDKTSAVSTTSTTVSVPGLYSETGLFPGDAHDPAGGTGGELGALMEPGLTDTATGLGITALSMRSLIAVAIALALAAGALVWTGSGFLGIIALVVGFAGAYSGGIVAWVVPVLVGAVTLMWRYISRTV